ncbi:MAG: TonB C-terminal domain-containing protein [Desulfuromonadales bacterium]|nr:TonB C-terminal domain-containing protein [Desulfuromonadales bacterium]
MPPLSTSEAHSNHDHPKLGRFLIVSLLLHTVTVVLLAGGWFTSPTPPKPQTYFVDLVHKPVLKPQAGRPDAPAKPKPATVAAPKPAPQPAAPAPSKPQPAPAKPATPAEPVKVSKPAAPSRPTPKPAPVPAVPDERRAEQQRQQALEELRARQARQAEIDALKQRLAGLQEAPAARGDEIQTPVGMPDGSGDEVGVSLLANIQATIQQNWALSPYLLDRARLGSIEARVLLAYAADGSLSRYRVIESSGDSQFDDSITRAIIKSRQLQQKLPRDTEVTVIFNLKEMVAARR